MISAVVFDFDGVLADSEPLHFEAFRDVFGARGWSLSDEDYYRRYLGYDDRDMIATFLRDRGLAGGDDVLAELAEEKREAFAARIRSRDVLFPGARECVAALRGRFRLAIASGALHEEVVAILTTGALIDAFPVIVGADDVAASKPAPDSYLEAARGLGVDPATCVAIEDSHWGLDAARAAGMRTIAVTTSSPAEALASADRVFGSVREVTVEVIASLG